MSTNNSHTPLQKETLSSVAAEMAQPRVVESAKRGGDTIANGGHIATTTSPKTMPVPRYGSVPALGGEQLISHLSLVPGWELIEGHHIVRDFAFPDFRSALAFVVQIGEIAEEQKHHPDILLSWGKVQATTWTHDVDGLSESDFILAAKINQIPL